MIKFGAFCKKLKYAEKIHFICITLLAHQWCQEREMLLTSQSSAFEPSRATSGP